MAFSNRITQFFTKIAFGASPRLYGRFSSGAGTGEEISIGSGLEIAGGELKAVGPVVRTRAQGYPTETERRKVVLNSGSDLAGDLAGLLVYLVAENTYLTPVTTAYSVPEYPLAAMFMREPNGLGGYRFKFSVTRDNTTTGEWLSVLDSITAPLYAVGGSGADATANPVVKSISQTVTELAPEYTGQQCVVGNEIFMSRSETGDWAKLSIFTP